MNTLLLALALALSENATDRVRSVVFQSYQTLLAETEHPTEVRVYGKELLDVVADADSSLATCRMGLAGPGALDGVELLEASDAMMALAGQLGGSTEKRLLEAHRQIGLLWFDLVEAELELCDNDSPPPPPEEEPPPGEEEPPPPPPAGEYPRPTPTGDNWRIDSSGAFNLASNLRVDLPAPISNWHGNERSNGSIPKRSGVAHSGDIGLVDPGDYPNVRYGTDRSPGWLFLRAQQPDTVRIIGKAAADTWYNERGHEYELADLELVGVQGTRALFKTDSGATSGGRYADIHLRNVVLNGQFSAERDVGRAWVKWGHHTYHMGYSNDPNALYGFVVSGPWGVWQGHIGDEHWFYDHNPSAPGVLIENVWVEDCRRNGVQSTNRATEGPMADARITVRHSKFRKMCLEDGGGGSVLTFKGQRRVEIWDVEVRLGADPLAPPYQDNITGAFVGEFQRQNCGWVEIVDCDFQTGPLYVGKGSARRPNIQWQAIERGKITGTRVAQAVGAAPAISFTPGPIVSLELDPENVVLGDVLWGGQKFPDRDADGDGWYDGDGYAAFLVWAAANEARVSIQ